MNCSSTRTRSYNVPQVQLFTGPGWQARLSSVDVIIVGMSIWFPVTPFGSKVYLSASTHSACVLGWTSEGLPLYIVQYGMSLNDVKLLRQPGSRGLQKLIVGCRIDNRAVPETSRL